MMVKLAYASQGSALRSSPISLTIPKSPHFNSTLQKRPPCKSQEEIDEEIASMPAFKARKLNQRVIDSCGDLGVPHILPKPLTELTPFELRTDNRAEAYSVRCPD